MPGGSWCGRWAGEAVRPGVERAPGPRGLSGAAARRLPVGARARRSAALGPGSQPSARPSVCLAVGRLLRAAGERAKLAHLSSAGAASTFKSRSSFSFTFCLLPGRAPLTWGREPPPIGCARSGRGESGGSAPSTRAGREQAVDAASAARGPESRSLCAWPAARKLERGHWHLLGSKLGARQPQRGRLQGRLSGLATAASKPRAFYFFGTCFGANLLLPGSGRGSRSWGQGPAPPGPPLGRRPGASSPYPPQGTRRVARGVPAFPAPWGGC